MKLFACDQNLKPRIMHPDPSYYAAQPSLNSTKLYATERLTCGQRVRQGPAGSRNLSPLDIFNSKLN